MGESQAAARPGDPTARGAGGGHDSKGDSDAKSVYECVSSRPIQIGDLIEFPAKSARAMIRALERIEWSEQPRSYVHGGGFCVVQHRVP